MTDPYTELLRQMGTKTGAPGWCLGTVKQGGKGQLRVAAAGLPLEKEDLTVSVSLDYRYDPSAEGFAYTPEMLRSGDQVLLLPSADGQRYYLIAKVADA